MGLYLVTVHKNQGGIGGKPWVNSYEVVTNGTIASPAPLDEAPGEVLLLRNLAGKIAAFETAFHLNTTYINRVTVSTWVPDSTPYNGNELVTVPISANGLREQLLGQEALGLDDTLYVRKTPQTGELGKIMYRGVLLELDSIVNAQGIKTLNGSSPIANGGSLWTDAVAEIAEGLMNWREQGDGEWAFAMIHTVGGESVIVRPILTFTPAGITPLKLNKKHYNKGAAKLQKEKEALEQKLAQTQELLNSYQKVD